jgi:hypothetical protein
MAQTARPVADKAFDYTRDAAETAAEQGRRTADQAADASRDVSDRTEDVARHGLQVVQRTADAVGEVQLAVAHRSAEGTVEFGRVLVELTVAQARQNLETLSALTGAVDWDRLTQIQGEYLCVSLERTTQLTRRYLELSQAVLGAATSAVQRQARQAA